MCQLLLYTVTKIVITQLDLSTAKLYSVSNVWYFHIIPVLNKSIQISILLGIIAVSVALLSSTGNVIYDSNRLKASQVQNLIQQLGFNTSILSEDQQHKNLVEVKVTHNIAYNLSFYYHNITDYFIWLGRKFKLLHRKTWY